MAALRACGGVYPVLVSASNGNARHASGADQGKSSFASGLRGADRRKWERPIAALDRAVRQIAEARLFIKPVECAGR
ncbi:MAG: hypothetical protein ACLUYV_03885 [Alistipes shahii]